ncbi:MAG: FkbM family methyltransferase [Magnetococcales bacterium]|nr:FkbM family methyltransferase [Magnetococcales bacterium]
MESFVDRVMALRTEGDISAKHLTFVMREIARICDAYDINLVIDSVYRLLAKQQVRAAFFVACILKRVTSLTTPGIAYALSIGGLLYEMPGEEKWGMARLQRAVDDMPSDKQAVFYDWVVRPSINVTLYTIIQKTDSKGSEHKRLARALDILRAAAPHLRPLAPGQVPSFRTLTSFAPTIKIVDIGASDIGGDPPYAPLLREGAELIGFDPSPGVSERLNKNSKSKESYLPYAVGDGQRHPLHLCNSGGMVSLLRPNPAVLNLFHGYPHWGEVIGVEEMATVRLDDLPEIVGAELLKMDIQGAELMVLRHAEARLRDLLVIQAEVAFLPLYVDQPLFTDVDQFLRERGFVLHRFFPMKSKVIQPLWIHGSRYEGMSQCVEADAVFVRDFTRLEALSDQQLLSMANILHDCYASYDLALHLLTEHDRRTGGQTGPIYFAGLGPAYQPDPEDTLPPPVWKR